MSALSDANRKLVERILGFGGSRTFSAHDANRLLDAARSEGPVWRPIETAPLGATFLAIDRKCNVRTCWRHKPSSRTDEILTSTRNGAFAATHWMPLPKPPALSSRPEGGKPHAS